ncbi:hypothetical protein LMG28688_02826 [Paraburkholderia caffeinitolerans]|uniref:DUF3375 domain-containing protein n=1 Tax=Paraburkholderia caffeinitolerans TaxID=1723730 RepID=A0A6J5G069_9BURK|nr:MULTISPECIES: DUF3375 domain-containing protein [Paraburkholderia]CAB3789313.1 hypothetical protein LMG28688_02826 [Paraburkholderia caffeinitolerans]
MDIDWKQRTHQYVQSRRQHPAWQLLAARSAPLVLSCLQTLFEKSHDGIEVEAAEQMLAALLEQHANSDEFGVDPDDDCSVMARKELRGWIRRSLLIERAGRLYATDALEEALRFVAALDGRLMTSTASRLSIVQREIENLESNLNPDPRSRSRYLQRKIQELERELEDVNAGNVRAMTESESVEGIREIYNLATSLRADFRRVEDSYREADQALRQSIVSERSHRGAIVDKLLNSHDELLETAEGKVFRGFQQQLGRSAELDAMKYRLRQIINHPTTRSALNPNQQHELRWLIIRLIDESAEVIRARARSERDVKGFLRTGLAAEHHRVGELIGDVLQQALAVSWETASVRGMDGPFPPVAISVAGLPLIERVRFKVVEDEAQQALELQVQSMDPLSIDDEFWEALDGLDRQALYETTVALLEQSGQRMGIAELARHLPPTHDLETIALWLSMAREAEALVGEGRESVDVEGRGGVALRFNVPQVELGFEDLRGLDMEL